MTGYEKRWEFTSQDGDQGELSARWAADGLRSGASLEVKNDCASWQTGNAFIEFECFVSGQWMPSGVHEKHTQAELWAHVVLGPMVLFAPTEYVRWVAKRYGQLKEMPKTRSSHPTRGYILASPQFVAALVGVARSAAGDTDRPAFPILTDDATAPFGRDGRGIPAAPYGYTKDRRVRLNPGGPRVGEPVPPAFWGEPGASRADGYEPTWAADEPATEDGAA